LLLRIEATLVLKQGRSTSHKFTPLSMKDEGGIHV
jgi:hypothetical protein